MRPNSDTTYWAVVLQVSVNERAVVFIIAPVVLPCPADLVRLGMRMLDRLLRGSILEVNQTPLPCASGCLTHR